MTTVICPRCGAANEPPGTFCGVCGAPLNAQPPAPEQGAQPPSFLPPAQVPPPPPQPGAYVPPPQGTFQPPPGGYQAPPPGAIPASAGMYPPGYVPKVMGNNTKWAVGLGIASFFCCGPLTAIPGIFLAKKDMDDCAAGRAPMLNDGWAKAAFYINIISLCLFVLGICVYFGLLGGMTGLRHF